MAGYEDPVLDPQGLSVSATDTPLIKVKDDEVVNQGNSIGIEPASKTQRLEQEANQVTFPDGHISDDSLTVFNDSLAKEFTSGGNWAYSLFKRGERENLSPRPDPSFDANAFIHANRDAIPKPLESQFHLATSDTEAKLILGDMTDELSKQAILARRGGFSTFVASGLAGIVDLDTPLSVLSGGASNAFKGGVMATKWGRIAGSAVGGGLTQAAAQTIAYEAGTTGDWTSIPAAGLGGMVFGTIGHAVFGHEKAEHDANAGVHAVVKDFDEYVADGAPLAQFDTRTETHLHDDPYGSRKANEAEEFPQENLVMPEGNTGKVVKLEDMGVTPDGIGSGERLVDDGIHKGGHISQADVDKLSEAVRAGGSPIKEQPPFQSEPAVPEHKVPDIDIANRVELNRSMGLEDVRAPGYRENVGTIPEWHSDVQSALVSLSKGLGLDFSPRLFVADAKEGSGSRGAISPSGQMIIAAGLDRTTAMTSALHEFGHHVDSLLISKMPQEVKDGINAMHQSHMGENAPDLTTHNIFPLSFSDQPSKTFTGSGAKYAASREEWFAEQVSRWVTTSEKPRNVVEQWFSKIGETWKAIYQKLTGHVPLHDEMKKFLDARWQEHSPFRSLTEAGSTMHDVQGDSGGSIGARQLPRNGSVATIQSSRIRGMILSAQNWANRTGISSEYNDKYVGVTNKGVIGDAVAKWASRFHDALASSPMATDFDRLWRSGSVVAQRLAYDTLESASGIIRNNRSAAMLQEMYRNQLGFVSEHYAYTRKLWDREQGLSPLEGLGSEHKKRFNREILTELQGRAYDAPGTDRGTKPSIKQAADAIDEFHKRDIAIGQGRPGEGAIKGYENFSSYSGYFPQKWSGAAMEDMIRNGGKTAKDIADAVSDMYVRQHNMTKDNADVYAAAVVNRARRAEQGLDTNLIGILQQDGSEFLADTLRANGVSTTEADALVAKLKGEAAERSQQGHTKKRLDVDMRYTSSNGVNMMDLMDNDVSGILARRVRTTSGAAALARKGISSKSDITSIIDAILEEQQARGPTARTGNSLMEKANDLIDRDQHLTREDLNDLFTNFTGGAISGGLSPFYANAKKLTNLVLLPQLGITQMAELGAQISTVGLKRWFEHAGSALQGNAINATSFLADELRHMGVMVPEEKYFRDDMNLDMERQGPGSSWLDQKIRGTLNSAQHVMGYSSLYYQVRNFQQRVAVTSAADKIMQNMVGMRSDLSAARAADIGLSPALYKRIQDRYAMPVKVNQHYTAPPVVEFKDGSLYKTNFDRWRPEDAEEFTLALNRHVNQTVQKAMAGESSVLFHKDGISSLFFHMKTFSLLAVEKQVLRNVRLQDGEALGTFFAGLTTAAAAYSVKQAVNGNTQNLTLDKMARGAIGSSNMTGWLPMWVDPIAGMLGLDDLKINQFGGSRGQTGDILSTPAALSALNTMLHIPAIAGHAATGNLSNNDVRALQATPLIGKAYGVTALLNSLKTVN